MNSLSVGAMHVFLWVAIVIGLIKGILEVCSKD